MPFATADQRCPPSNSSPRTSQVVQWLVVIASGHVPLWSPLTLNLGQQLERMHEQEARFPSSASNPRWFHLPILCADDALPLCFGTNIPYYNGLSIRVNMRTGVILLPVFPYDPALGQSGLQRPLRRVIRTHAHT